MIGLCFDGDHRKYREECRAHGKEARIGLLREAWLADTDEQARAEYGPHVVHAHKGYFPRMQGGWKSEETGGKPQTETHH